MIITKQGHENIKCFISELKEKKKEILDAGEDTANETTLPTEEDIICDIMQFLDNDGDYLNSWGCTDNTNLGIGLMVGSDFILEEKDKEWMPVVLLEEFEIRKSQCQNCARLTIENNGEYICKRTHSPCKYITDCQERDWPYSL